MKRPEKARIFVRLASYRDAECHPTVEDAFAKAAHPERVSFGICWQFQPGVDERVPSSSRPRQVRFLRVPARETRGVCWARFQAEQLWRDEEYTLQVDSHSRFAPGWDVTMLAELGRCPSPKSVLSTSPSCYTPPDVLEPDPALLLRSAAPFNEDGTLHFRAHFYDGKPDRPVPGAFVSGGFLFSRAELLREVPYDPYLYFNQEEAAYALRLYTHGWDVFSPTEVLVYHYYNPGGSKAQSVRPLHWNDDPAWMRMNRIGLDRFHHLTGSRPSSDPEVVAEIDRFGLGRARTVASYEAFAGVDFRARRVLERALRGEVAADAEPAPLAAAPKIDTAPAAAADAETDRRRPAARAALWPEAPLRVGAFVPPFSLLDAHGETHEIRAYAGQPVALFLLPDGDLGSFQRFADALTRQAPALRAPTVLITPVPAGRLRGLEQRLRWSGRLWSDPDLRVSRLFGARRPTAGNAAPTSCLLDARLRLAGLYRGELAAQLGALAAGAAALLDAPPARVVTAQAPVLLVPGVLDATELARAAACPDGDRALPDELAQQIDRALGQTLLPEVCRVFGADGVRRAPWVVAAPDAPGPEPGWTVIIELDDDYDGGELAFPEYGPALYRPPAGGALVCSTALLRRARPITRGAHRALTTVLG
jgi:peroxiredoxin